MTRLSLITLALSLLLAACAQQREPVDRVQPNGIDKSFFVGADLLDTSDNPEFWAQGTLVDVGYGAAQDGLFTSTYAQPMSRIKWQITENLLLGRLAYERIANSDGKGVGGKTEEGVIVVAYPIEKHFDIVQGYNPTTGEQLNILEENAIDRPWYERQYMRVDWSRNLNVDSYDFDTLSLLGIYGSVKYESLAYDVTDPNSPDAPFFDTEGGYFDVTSKAFAKPLEIDLSALGWGIDKFPACFLDADFMGGSFPAGSCSPVELTIRQAFRRVEDTDFEPKDWDGYRFQSYGAFTVERMGYARNYGMSDDMWHRFITRYDIWYRSHHYEDPESMTGPIECYTPETTPFGADPRRDEDGNGTHDECETAGLGSQCDIYRQRCTLPYAEREAETIVWYYTEGSNPDFYEPTEWATHDWDVAMRVAVASAKRAECNATGQESCASRYPVYTGQQTDNVDAIALAREVDACRSGAAYEGEDCEALADSVGAKRGYSDGVIAVAKMPEMIVLCHSPVAEGDHEACGPVGTRVRKGDLRYHQVNVITEPQTPSPWGIYTDAEDPLTGQTVSASINVWSHVNDLWSQKVIDMLRYIGGELSTEDITEGENVRAWAEAAEAASMGGAAPKLDREAIHRRMADFTGSDLETAKRAAAGDVELAPEVLEKARLLKRELSGVAASFEAPTSNGATYSARRESAAGTQFEAGLMTKMMQDYAGTQGMPVTDGLMDLTSPLRGANPALKRDLYHMKEHALAERGACILHEASAPMALTGLSDVLQEKFGAFNPDDAPGVQQERAERMRRYLARRAQYAVVVHEMGHSIGLRHNFISSSDAFNYRPQYWQLRTRNGEVSAPCSDLQADGAGCVGPRYFDPVTEGERDGLLWMWMHSSVMDYAGELTQDMLGLGAYDFAAAKMFYGDTVAVYSDPSYLAGTARGYGVVSKVDDFGGLLGIQPTYNGEEIHYSALQDRYDLISDCVNVNAQDFKPASWNEDEDGLWHPIVDGLIVPVDGEYSRCRQQPVDYVPWDQLKMPTNAQIDGWYGGGVSIDPQSRVRVPYGFATDRWADLGNASVYRHDNGADVYEIFNFLMTQQEVGHIFNNYRRGRQSFSVSGAANRALYRFNTKLRDGAKGLGLMRNIYEDFATENGFAFDAYWEILAPIFFPENILASGMVFDHFTRLLARPQDGEHFRPQGDPVLRSKADTYGDGPTQIRIPNGATGYFGDIGIGGRPVENALASDKGDYSSDFTVNAGSYYDKIFTSMLMTESIDNFISDSREDFVDARYRAVSLADLFPDGYRRWLANNLTDDDRLKGARVAANSSGTPLTDADGYPSQPIGWTSWWGEEVRACFPSENSTICSSYGNEDGDGLDPQKVANTVPIDPQVGWEQQKFLIAWTLLYLPENQQLDWLDMLQIWELGPDSDPEITNRIELHHPSGKVYIAKTYGKETVFGDEVQRGIAARTLEYANSLLVQAYEVEDGPDLDGDGQPDWWVPTLNEETGQPMVKYDPNLTHFANADQVWTNGPEGCNVDDSSECACTDNLACMALQDYIAVPAYLREAIAAYGLGGPGVKGIW